MHGRESAPRLLMRKPRFAARAAGRTMRALMHPSTSSFVRLALPWGLAATLTLAASAFALIGRAAPAAGAITELRVGIDARARPVSTGERDYTSGAFEAVYARDLAQRLGATLTLVPLPPDGAWRALREGEVDLVLGRAGAGGGAEGLPVLRTGYHSGLGVSMRADRPARGWDELRHRTLCTSADNTRAQALAARLGARLQVHAAPAQALVRVRTGDCDAAILDHAQLAPLLARKEWTRFAATLPPTGSSALQAWLAPARAALAAPLRAAMAELDDPLRWAQRRQAWAANVAFEVHYDQTGPDCH